MGALTVPLDGRSELLVAETGADADATVIVRPKETET